MADNIIDQVPATEPPAQIDPAIEAEARRGGWKPKDQYNGDPNNWVDAGTFVQRGRAILPHVQRHASHLEQENATLKAQQAAHAAELETLRTQVTGLTQFQADMDRQARTRMRAEILDEIQQARAAGDFTREAKALDRLTAAPPTAPVLPVAPVSPAAPPAPARVQIPQEMTDWAAANPWYQRDPVMQQAMTVVGADLRASGQLVGMSLTEQLNATARVVQQRYMPAPNNGGSRVEGGARPPGDGPGQRTAPANGWESLPAHIKQECDQQGERLGLVGKGKTFATKEAWREHYVRQYQRYEPNVGYDYRPPGN